MKIAMFGGSFNPIHNGHIMLAKAFAKELALDKLLIIPTYIKMIDEVTASDIIRVANKYFNNIYVESAVK